MWVLLRNIFLHFSTIAMKWERFTIFKTIERFPESTPTSVWRRSDVGWPSLYGSFWNVILTSISDVSSTLKTDVAFTLKCWRRFDVEFRRRMTVALWLVLKHRSDVGFWRRFDAKNRRRHNLMKLTSFRRRISTSVFRRFMVTFETLSRRQFLTSVWRWKATLIIVNGFNKITKMRPCIKHMHDIETFYLLLKQDAIPIQDIVIKNCSLF